MSSDWRLQGQEKYLRGATLRRQHYTQNPTNPRWDHDHCEFCSAKFMVGDASDALHEGYCTLDEYRWICIGCFEDFKNQFEWKVAEASASSEREP